MKVLKKPKGSVFPVDAEHDCGAVLQLQANDVTTRAQHGCKGTKYFTKYYWEYTCACCGCKGYVEK